MTRFVVVRAKSKNKNKCKNNGKCKYNGNDRSRFPSGMTNKKSNSNDNNKCEYGGLSTSLRFGRDDSEVDGTLSGDRSLAGAANGVGVFEEDAAFVAGCWCDECGEAFGDLFVGDVEG